MATPVSDTLATLVSAVVPEVVAEVSEVRSRSLTVRFPDPSTASPAPAITPPRVVVVAAGKV
jgi:hypothetical protein